MVGTAPEPSGRRQGGRPEATAFPGEGAAPQSSVDTVALVFSNLKPDRLLFTGKVLLVSLPQN